MIQSFVLNFIIGILEQVFKLSKALECLRGVDPYLSLMYVVFSSRTIIILWSRRKGCASVKTRFACVPTCFTKCTKMQSLRFIVHLTVELISPWYMYTKWQGFLWSLRAENHYILLITGQAQEHFTHDLFSISCLNNLFVLPCRY